MAVTNEDLFKLMKDLVTKTEEIQQQNKTLKEEIKSEIRTVKSEIFEHIEKLSEENKNLKEENQHLKDLIEAVEKKTKKYNIIVYGLEESDADITDIQSFFKTIYDKLNVNCNFSDIRDIYRFGKRTAEKIRPLSVEFVSYKLKLEILQKAKLLKGTRIFISNDYTQEEYKTQKILRQYLQIARKNNYSANIKNKILYVDGEAYTCKDLESHILRLEGRITDDCHLQEENLNEREIEKNQKQSKTLSFVDQINKKRKQSGGPAEETTSHPQKRVTRRHRQPPVRRLLHKPDQAFFKFVFVPLFLLEFVNSFLTVLRHFNIQIY